LRVNVGKRGIRVLGIAESFGPGDDRSVLAGVVIRRDLVIDGFALGSTTVGGDDATKAVVSLFRALRRRDVNLVMISGCIISKYNILDVDRVGREIALPVICLTYRETSGIEEAISRRFSAKEAALKLDSYKKLGLREKLKLGNGYSVYARLSGISAPEAEAIVREFTLQGSQPEPVRVAGLMARAGRVLSSRGSASRRGERGTNPHG
jgi:uncharacterized protein